MIMGIFTKELLLIISLMTLTLVQLSLDQDLVPQNLVNAHNAARARVGVGPVAWDENVAAYARDYANKRAGDCNLVHSGGPYWENIAWSSGDISGVDAVNLWVNEKKFYDYGSNSCAPGESCGHYTQVVWRNSVRFGCAKVRCSTGGTFIGCNFIGQRPY